MSFKVPVGLSLLCLFSLVNSAQAVSYGVVARVQPPTSWLTLETERPEFVDQSKNGKLDLQVSLSGTFSRPGWSLLVGTRKVEVTRDGKFQASVRVALPYSSIVFIAVSPSGQIEQRKISLQTTVVKDAPKPKLVVANKTSLKPKSTWPIKSRYQFTFGTGLSLISFTQTDLQDFSEKGITAKGSVVYALVPGRWDIGLSSYVTLLPFSSNTPDFTARYLGINGRVGYTVAGVRSPWRVTLQTGLYYTTMIVTDSAFGLTSLIGPQFMPVLSRSFGAGRSLAAYVKFAPVTGLGETLSFSNRELATGVSWAQPLSYPYSVLFSADYAEIGFQSGDQVAKSKSLSFGVALQW